MEAAKQHYKQLTNAESVDTDYDVVIAGPAGTTQLTQHITIQNNSAAAQTIEVKLIKYTTAYETIFSKSYSFAADANETPAAFCLQTLVGDDTHPDKITVSFSSALGASETIDCLASTVEFA